MMQESYIGPLGSYNSLQDEHLAEYFSNPCRVRHLKKMGLVTKDGKIVSEGSFRRNAARKEHKAHSKELLADAIVSNALEIERKRTALLKKKLEFLAKIEIVERVKSQKIHPPGVQEFSPHMPRFSHWDTLGFPEDQLQDERRSRDRMKLKRRSPYHDESHWSRTSTPMPRPPSAPRPHSSTQGPSRRLQLTHQNGRPRTAPASGHRTFPSRSQPARSEAHITLRYIGRGPAAAEVLVLQQHCGGNTVPLYQGSVKPGELLTFESKRHLRMPFGLSIYLDGLIDSRVSACCEYKHQCGKFLGSRSAHFRLIKVEGGAPCSKCTAERERAERKQKDQKLLDEAINSSPSAEREQELDQLLMRNGVADPPEDCDRSLESSSVQLEFISHQVVDSNHLLDSEQHLEGESHEIEAVENDLVASKDELDSRPSSDTRHSHSLDAVEPIREQDSGDCHSVSSMCASSRETTTTENNKHLSDSIAPRSADSSVLSAATVGESGTSREQCSDYEDDIFEEAGNPHKDDYQDSDSNHEPGLALGPGQAHAISKELPLQDTIPTVSSSGSEDLNSVQNDSSAVMLFPPSSASIAFSGGCEEHEDAPGPKTNIDWVSSDETLVTHETEQQSSSTELEATLISAANHSETAELDSHLSPSLTLQEATLALEKSPSASSLGSVLSELASEAASSVDLTDQDEDIPDLEQKICELSDKTPSHSSLIGESAPLQESPSLSNEEESDDNRQLKDLLQSSVASNNSAKDTINYSKSDHTAN